MTLRRCSDCHQDKDEATSFERLSAGKCRNQCKECRRDRRKVSATSDTAKRAKETNRRNTPLPHECAECKRRPPEVEFKWRDDTVRGGWRQVCNACDNARGYYVASRERKKKENGDEFRKHNAAVHLDWAHRNPENVRRQEELLRVDPGRKAKALFAYDKRKNAKKTHDGASSTSVIGAADADAIKATFSRPCHYCGRVPDEGQELNSLDGPYDDASTVAACGTCSKMKGCVQPDAFVDNVRRIYVTAIVGQRENARTTVLANNANEDPPLADAIALWTSACYLCGRTPAYGIDRVGGCCRPCCAMYCSMLKRDWDLHGFLAHVRRVFEHTRTWMLRDVGSMPFLAPGYKEKRPVAGFSPGAAPTLVFPSAGVAGEILGVSRKAIEKAMAKGHACAGKTWRCISRREYDETSRLLSETCDLADVIKKHRRV